MVWPFDDGEDDECYRVQVSPDAFVDFMEDLYTTDDRYGREEQDLVAVEKEVLDRPQRFKGFSTRLHGPHVAAEYSFEAGDVTVSTRSVVEYDEDRETALEEAEIDEEFPEYVHVV